MPEIAHPLNQLPFLTSLLLLVALSRALGALALRFRQPTIVGELFAGILLGPTLLNLVQPTHSLSTIAELAVFLIVLGAGLEMDFRDVIESMMGKGAVIAASGFVVPLLFGIAVGIAWDMDVMRTVFLGLSMAITALPVVVKIIESLKLQNTLISRYSVATAILNDVASMMALGVILDIPEKRSFSAVVVSIGVTGGKLLLFAVLVWIIYRVLRSLDKRSRDLHLLIEKFVRFSGAEGLFGVALVFVLVFSSISETLGFHFVIGAFFGALLLSANLFGLKRFTELQKTLNSMTGGFLAPIFFAYLGLEFDLSAMESTGFVVVVILISIFSKILAGYVGGTLGKLSKGQSIGIGVICNSRGVMGLVVAGIAFERQFIDQGLFSTLVLMSVVTTIITPLLFTHFALPELRREKAVAETTKLDWGTPIS